MTIELHSSDCAVHNEPAYPKGRCDCGLLLIKQEVANIIGQEYDADPWECADSAVETAIQKQLERVIDILRKREGVKRNEH